MRWSPAPGWSWVPGLSLASPAFGSLQGLGRDPASLQGWSAGSWDFGSPSLDLSGGRVILCLPQRGTVLQRVGKTLLPVQEILWITLVACFLLSQRPGSCLNAHLSPVRGWCGSRPGQPLASAPYCCLAAPLHTGLCYHFPSRRGGRAQERKGSGGISFILGHQKPTR